MDETPYLQDWTFSFLCFVLESFEILFLVKCSNKNRREAIIMYRLKAGAFRCCHDLHKTLFYFSFCSFWARENESGEKFQLLPEMSTDRVFSSTSTTFPFALAVMNKSSVVDFFSRVLDGLWRENRGSVNRLDWNVKITCNNYYSKSKKGGAKLQERVQVRRLAALSSLFNIKACSL